jgi:hypothetical protein
MVAECICVYMQFCEGTEFIFRNDRDSGHCNREGH